MKKVSYLIQCIIGLSLSFYISTVLANNNAEVEKESIVNNTRIPTQYLSVAKIHVGNSSGYVYIDRKSIKLHPYNKLIRTYTRVINYSPAVSKTIHDKTILYRSIMIKEFVNCDKKEYAKSLVEIYQNEFGKGKLYDSDDVPKRWEATVNDEKEKQNLIIVCALPLNNG